MLAPVKTWPLEEVVVADSVTLFFGTLLIKLSLKSFRLLKPDHWTERNTNSQGWTSARDSFGVGQRFKAGLK